MQTLIPQPAQATAHPTGKTGRLLGYGLTPRALWLFATGFLLSIPAFWHPQRIVFLLAWDALLLALILFDALRLPKPERLIVTRTFRSSPQLGQPTTIELSVEQDTNTLLHVRITDDLHPALTSIPATATLEAFPRDTATTQITVTPRERGDITLSRIFLRYTTTLGLVERWASALPTPQPSGLWALDPEPSAPQTIRIYPAHTDSSSTTQLFLLRARQLERQRRRLRLRGTGREFESLRDYADGDELRNLSWTATARRGRLITRQFTVERSQQVWIVLDAGRLSRTALALHREAPSHIHETEIERETADTRTITQLDEAATAAITLAQVIASTGDKCGLLTYGRGIQQRLQPGTGAVHLRLMLEQLAQTKSEAAEADHLNAVTRLKNLQRRRSLVIWITELVDQAGRPDLIAAAADLSRRHLVLLVLLEHPELEALAAKKPTTREEMYAIAAAEEMLERRRESIAQLERAGVLIVETTPAEAGARAINKYLEIKSRSLL